GAIRELWHPLTANAASDTAKRPVLEKIMPNLRGETAAPCIISRPTHSMMLAIFQPHMVKIRFAGEIVAKLPQQRGAGRSAIRRSAHSARKYNRKAPPVGTRAGRGVCLWLPRVRC